MAKETGLVKEVKAATRKKVDRRKEIKVDLANERESWYKVAVNLSEIYHSGMYVGWGFDKFELYAETDLDLNYRTAMYRVQMGDAILATGVTKAQLAGIGWTKFKEMSSLLNSETSPEELKKILEDTKDLTFRETQDYVKAKRLKKEIVSQTVKFQFSFIDEQAELVNEVLDTVCALIDTENKNLALEYVLTEWQMNHNPELKERIMANIHVEEEEKVERKAPAHKGKTAKAA